MKYQLIKSLLVLALSVLAFNSAQAETFNRYLNTQAALADVDNMDEGIAAIVTYGARVPEVSKRFFIEGEVTTSIVDPEAPGIEISYFTVGAYAMYAPEVTDDMTIRLRAGLLYQDISSNNAAADDGDVELSFGFGVGYTLGKTTNLIIEYTHQDEDISHIGAGIQFKL